MKESKIIFKKTGLIQTGSSNKVINFPLLDSRINLIVCAFPQGKVDVYLLLILLSWIWFLILPLTRHPIISIYNDVRECSVSSRKRSPTFCMRNLDFEEKICHAQHSSLFSDINNCDYACTWIASLKGERSDSKTKLKALFFSYRKPRFWIHKLEFECKLQIFPLFISVFKISITVTLFLAITVQLVLME